MGYPRPRAGTHVGARRAAAGVAFLALALGAAACGQDRPSQRGDDRAAVAERPLPVAPTSDPRDDAEIDQSFPIADQKTLTKRPPAPSAAEPASATASGDGIAEGAPSDAQIRRELRQMERVQRSYESGAGAPVGTGARATLNDDGTATAPKGAPEALRRIIGAANEIAKFPYVYGGGHRSFVDTAYDCSGSVSYALAAAGLVKRPMVSGEFATSGEPGPGRWITIYANGGHMFMTVAGLRYDTSGRGGPLGSRWQTTERSAAGLEVRHPPGL